MVPNTNWIWLRDEREAVNGKPRLVYFRKTIWIAKKPLQKKIKISADTRYKLYINGTLVETGPSRGDQKVWYYDEVEIALYLQEGKNVIAVEVLRYPIACGSGNYGMFRTATPGLYVEETADGQASLEISADESWKYRQVKAYEIQKEAEGYAPMMILEARHGDEAEKNWRLIDYEDSSWQQAYVYSPLQVQQSSSPGDLQKRTIPFMQREAKQFCGLVPKKGQPDGAEWDQLLSGKGSVEIPANSRQVVELQAESLTCGYLSLRMEGGSGTTVKILSSEGYVQHETAPNGRVPQKADRCDWEHGYLHGFTDRYYVSGYGDSDGQECYEPY